MAKKKDKLDKKLFMVILAIALVFAFISFLINDLLPIKVVLWIFAPAGLILYGVFFFSVFSDPERKLRFFGYVALCTALICSIPLLHRTNAYEFADGSSFPFWKFDLSLGVICGVVCFVILIKNGKQHMGRLLLGSVGIALISALLISSYTANLNYMLDSNKPEEYTATIEEKEMRTHRKAPTTYEFSLTVEGEELDLEVGFLDYNNYEVGDTYTVKKYQGAFYVPFYCAN